MKYIDDLGSPEARILVCVLLIAIAVLWSAFKSTYSDINKKNAELETRLEQRERSYKTEQILWQDKVDMKQQEVDECKESRLKELQDLLNQSEKMKARLRALKP